MEKIQISKNVPASELVAGRQVQAQYVSANISQESNVNLNIRVVPSKGIDLGALLKICRPRKSNAASPNDFRFPEIFTKNFKEVNAKVTSWLAASNDNVQLYLKDPVSALAKAGVELSREDQKSLSRSFENVKANFLAAPGTNIKSFNPSVTGTQTNIPNTGTTGTTGAAGNKDCFC